MMNYIILAVAFSVTIALTPLVRKVAMNLKIYDVPSKERIHKGVIPRLGGVAIFLGFVISLIIGISLVDYELSTQKQLILILVVSFIIFILGLFDDIKQINPIYKLSIEFLIVTLFLSNLGVHIEQNNLSLVVLAFWIVFIMNSFNNIDGIDGLASGVAVICCLSFLIVYSNIDSIPSVMLSLALIGTCSAFLIFNFNPAKIFMGDSGSLFIGFILSVIPIVGFLNIETTLTTIVFPIIILGFLIFDSSFVLIKRLAKGKSLFTWDLEHTYNLMLNRMKSQKKTVLFIYLVNILLGVLSLVLFFI